MEKICCDLMAFYFTGRRVTIANSHDVKLDERCILGLDL